MLDYDDSIQMTSMIISYVYSSGSLPPSPLPSSFGASQKPYLRRLPKVLDDAQLQI